MDIILWVTIGLPASGKTTWARTWVSEDPNNRVRVNRDDIRRMLGPYWVPQREDLVTDIEDSIILNALEQNYSVIVDATNLRGTQRFVNLLKPSWWNKVKLEIKDFRGVPVEKCIERDMNRPKEERVGTKVILNMAKKYDLL